MTIRTNTVEYVFDQRLTALAPATRHDFAAITVDIPETGTRTFDSVFVEVTATDAQAATASRASIASWLIGVKVDAVAFSDITVTDTVTDSGDHTSWMFVRDLTSYFTTNFTSSSHAVQIGFQYSATGTGPASLQNVAAKLVCTYRYSDASGTTRVKTVRIPLESNTTALSASFANIGTNQIPILNTFLPEAGKSIKSIWFEVSGNNGGNGTTDFSLTLALDAETPGTAMGLYEMANNSAIWARHIYRRNDLDTSLAHNFKALVTSTTGGTHNCLVVLLCVTYTFDESSTTSVLNSIALPFRLECPLPGTAAAERQRTRLSFRLSEPGTLTLVQSAVCLNFIAAANANISIGCGSQAMRAYTVTFGSITCGMGQLQQRIDSGSAQGAGVSLALSASYLPTELTINAFGATNAVNTMLSGLVYLNYTSTKANHWGKHAHTVRRLIRATAADATYDAIVTLAPLVVGTDETEWSLMGLGPSMGAMYTGASQVLLLQAEVNTGEAAEDGWRTLLNDLATADGEFNFVNVFADAGSHFRRHVTDVDTTRMSPTASRRWRMGSLVTAWKELDCWATYHAHQFTVGGTISDSAGGTVNLKLFDATSREYLESSSRVGNGAYSFAWHDERSVFVEAYEDGTHTGRSANVTPTRA